MCCNRNITLRRKRCIYIDIAKIYRVCQSCGKEFQEFVEE
jgi:hypothetical protein